MMDFSEALEELKDGERVRRELWSEDAYIELQQPDENSKMTNTYIFVNNGIGEIESYNPTNQDIMACDWECFEEEDSEPDITFSIHTDSFINGMRIIYHV